MADQPGVEPLGDSPVVPRSDMRIEVLVRMMSIVQSWLGADSHADSHAESIIVNLHPAIVAGSRCDQPGNVTKVGLCHLPRRRPP